MQLSYRNGTCKLKTSDNEYVIGGLNEFSILSQYIYKISFTKGFEPSWLSDFSWNIELFLLPDSLVFTNSGLLAYTSSEIVYDYLLKYCASPVVKVIRGTNSIGVDVVEKKKEEKKASNIIKITGRLVALNDTTDLMTLVFETGGKLQSCRLYDRSLLDNVNLTLYNWYTISGVKVDESITVASIELIARPTVERKRVEFGVKTKYSQNASTIGLDELKTICEEYGIKQVGLADTDSMHAVPHLLEQMDTIPGAELKVQASNTDIVTSNEELLNREINKLEFTVVDFESTGLDIYTDEIIEIGATKLVGGFITDTFHTYVKANKKISKRASEITGITDSQLQDAMDPVETLEKLIEFIGNSVFVAHNAAFDYSILKSNVKRYLNRDIDYLVLDTLKLSRKYLADKLKSFSLDRVASYFGIEFKHHNAAEDSKVTAEILQKILYSNGIKSLSDVIDGKQLQHPYSVHVYAKNADGLYKLHQLISKSHVESGKYGLPEELVFGDPNLLYATGFEDSELYESITSNNFTPELLNKYDFIELQPLDSYKSLTIDGAIQYTIKVEEVNEDKRPIVAISGARYCTPTEKIAYEILKGKGEQIPNLHIRTSDELLNMFMPIFGPEVSKIIFDNGLELASQCTKVQIVDHKLKVPDLGDTNTRLREKATAKLKELYGDDPVATERVEYELSKLTQNNFSVIYYLAYKIVKDNNNHGYIVGSRGSVGSSFVAYLLGITEVNPLKPHYRCPKCKRVEYVDIGCGYDLPPKRCPNCGTELLRLGFNIPFETFLGINGNKVPDIDLNVSSEYQENSHKYLISLIDKDKVFRAGTILTIGDKLARSMVHKYVESTGNQLNIATRLMAETQLVGVKRTTGAHPGGMIVIPDDVFKYTPYQFSADKDGDIYTTHYEYELLHDDLIKLDILGHTTPTMIRRLEDLTGVKNTEIDLCDRNVLNMFKEADVIGVPEFETNFARGMIREFGATSFEKLVKMSGFAHGTGIWAGGIRELLLSGQANENDVMAARDDIMNYLVSKGLDRLMAFKIMEDVRKGNGLKPEYEEAMRKADIPDWYISMCKKIKYMFPKAHAAAYVIMSFKLAWYKYYYPLEFYSVYLTEKADEFDWDVVSSGVLAINRELDKNKGEKDKIKGKNTEQTYTLVLEFLNRGYEFLKPDVNKSHYHAFLVENGKIRVPLDKLTGIGPSIAKKIYDNRGTGYKSIQDISKLNGLSKQQVMTLQRTGAFDGLSSTDEQITLF